VQITTWVVVIALLAAEERFCGQSLLDLDQAGSVLLSALI
jgi:hypothetical protein